MIKIGEIIILDQDKANKLLHLGFKYVKKNIDNKEVFVFIQTNELMKELSQKFGKKDFIINKVVCF